ncbi:PREDICTED: cysteine-rich receptor-like protein kinase 10 [Camelina sativa]|uniref:Cysteine-rich receptor-like protein kinase 10 n=1 Tax=Camelina sativa TaxID=90675 RepID=A0ABM0WI90_CAMSA|nr:PREDICTED: cysteine-rich receptor-like protein kinase 10 [Camelina sativa]XP_010471457.1 PREDICTED: cysteine-rich receptor-like protein kinase 10 [Camelina sativa]
MVRRLFSGLMALLKMCDGQAASRKEESAEDDGDRGIIFDLQELETATDFFSEKNRLGTGGFGLVYKGLMTNGEEIAVKKLSVNSRQGSREFTNEVKLLLRIQHKNLVSLLGCCFHGPEKMLVYEYLPNRSLDYFLFDKIKPGSLDWHHRWRIIIGVARGLLYLHEEAPIRIIHRDIKASNILLDNDLNPKISDFGLARLFPGDGTHTNTFKISGTYGYMAPEYALHGLLSVKSDVFSYGVLVLEIVSGRKNQNTHLGPEMADLLHYAWKMYQEGKILELVDQSLAGVYNRDEAATCFLIGLLCCQQITSNRPDMNTVHQMLSSDSFDLPKPGRPGLQGRRGGGSTSTGTGTGAGSRRFGLTGSEPNSFKNRRSSGQNGLVEEYSRNSISMSSFAEGR